MHKEHFAVGEQVLRMVWCVVSFHLVFWEDQNILNERVNQCKEESYNFSKSCLVYLSYLSFVCFFCFCPIISLSMGERKRERQTSRDGGGWVVWQRRVNTSWIRISHVCLLAIWNMHLHIWTINIHKLWFQDVLDVNRILSLLICEIDFIETSMYSTELDITV